MYANKFALSLIMLLMPHCTYSPTKHNFIDFPATDNSCTAESLNSHVVCCFSQVTMKGKGVVREQKREKNASKDQGPAEVGLLADLLSKLRAEHKGGIVGIVSCRPVYLNNDYLLTPRGKKGEGHRFKE